MSGALVRLDGNDLLHRELLSKRIVECSSGIGSVIYAVRCFRRMEVDMIGAYLAKRDLAKAFDAMNRHDLPAFMSFWHDQSTLVYPGEIRESGVFEGKTAVEAWFRHFFEQFSKIEFHVQDICVRNIMDLVGNNVAAVHWNIEVTNREGWVGKNSGVTVVTIKSGKVVKAIDFIFDLGDMFHRNWSAPR